MSLRGFGPLTLTGSAQPLFGSTLGAAVTPSPDFYTGRLDPGSQPSSSTITLSAAYSLRVGDRIAIGTAASFEQGSTIPPDGGTIQKVVSATEYVVTGLMRAHASGEFVVLAMACAQISIQAPAANTETVYLGEDATVSSTSTTLSAQIPIGALVPPFTVPQGAGGNFNMVETQKLWVIGTNGNGVLPSILTI